MKSAPKYSNANPEVVRRHLTKILSYEKFKVSYRLSRFIDYVVEETLNHRSDSIKAYSIAVEVFDRDSEFDGQADPIVRIYAGRLRQALKEYYLTEGKNDELQINIPKGTYVPKFLSADEIKKEVASKTGQIRSQSRISKKSLRLILVAFIGISIAAFFIVNALNNNSSTDELGRTTIQISPFQHLGTLADNETFSKSLVEQTKMALGQFSSIVIDNSSDNQKRSANKSDYTMTGSVQQQSDIFKVMIKLVDNKTNVQIFSKEYDESINTNAAEYIEELFANKIAIDLADEFGEVQKFRLRSAQSSRSVLMPHEAVLLYYDYLTHLSKEDNDLVLSKLKKTVEEHNDYEPAWAAMSGLYMDRYLHFGGDEQDLELAKQTVEKAELINPRSRHVQKHLAFIAYVTGNLEAFYDAADKQLTLNPNSTMLGQTGLWYCLIGDYAKGIPLIEQAKERNAYYPRYLHFGSFFYYYDTNDLISALSEAEKVRLPYIFWDPLLRLTILAELNRIEEAKVVLAELLELKPNFKTEGRELMNRGLYLEEHQTKLIKALEKVGMELD